jgi:uncharacterized protein YaeQ
VALPSALYDFQIDLRNVDRSIEQPLQLKVARHPSETLERVWLRVLAHCALWDERLTFGPGLSEPDAADALSTDYTGQVTRWIRVGRADPERIQKVLDRNPHAGVALFFESPARMQEFAEAARLAELRRAERLELWAVDPELLAALCAKDARRSKLTLTLVGDHAYVDREGTTVDGPLERARL